MRFVVEGIFNFGRMKRSFIKEIEARNEKMAADSCLSKFGSVYGLPRNKIQVTAVRKTGSAHKKETNP